MAWAESVLAGFYGIIWGKSKHSRDGNLEKDAECDYFRINILSLEKTTNKENC